MRRTSPYMAAPPMSQLPSSPAASLASSTPGKAAVKASLASSGWPAAYPSGWEDDDQMAIYFAEMQPLPLGGNGSASNVASRTRAERVRFWTEAIELFLEARSIRAESTRWCDSHRADRLDFYSSD